MTKRIPLNTQIEIKMIERGFKKQQELADLAGVSQSFISRLLDGTHTNIGLENLRRISKALDFYEWDLNLGGY